MFVDNTPALTFEGLVHRFARLGMTAESYRRRFKLPLSFEDITNPKNAAEIVAYRPLIEWFHHGRTSKVQDAGPRSIAGLPQKTTRASSGFPDALT